MSPPEAKLTLSKSQQWWVLSVLLAGLGLRLWFIWRLASISDDTRMYADIAQNLLRHHIYGLTDGGTNQIRPTIIRLPGYPLFLALCFRLFGMARFGTVIIVQAALDLCTCLLLAATARRIFTSAAGFAALCLGSLCPFLANYVAAPLTETPTLFCMALAFYSLARWQDGSLLNRWLFPLSFALAWAVLLRPEQGMLAVAIVPSMLYISWRRDFGGAKCLQPAVAVSLLAMLPLVPWTIRNWRTFHVIQPLAPRYANDAGELNPYGFQRWYRTWAVDFASTEQVYWKFDGETINLADLPARAFDSPEQFAETASILSSYNQDPTPTPALDARFGALARERIQAHPIRYFVFLPFARLTNMIVRPRLDNLNFPLDWWNFRTHPGYSAVAACLALLNLAYLTLAGAALRLRAWKPAFSSLVWAMCTTVLLRCMILLTVDNSEPRYTLEFYPVLIIFAGSALAGFKQPNKATVSGRPCP